MADVRTPKPNEDPTDTVVSAGFKPLIAVLQGLRSHDERLVDSLATEGRYDFTEVVPEPCDVNRATCRAS